MVYSGHVICDFIAKKSRNKKKTRESLVEWGIIANFAPGKVPKDCTFLKIK